jgi:hypothetical protein
MVSAMAKHCETLGYKKARAISKLEVNIKVFILIF